MLKNLLVSGLTILGFLLGAQPFQATYGFPNIDPTTGITDPGPFPQVSGLVFGPFSASGVSAAPNASGRFSFTGWPLGAADGDDNFANFTGALSPMAFYQVTIRVLPSHTLQLNSIDFSVRRSGTGIRNYCIRSSLDNFTNNLSVGTGTNTRLSVIPTNVFFWKYDSISTSGDQFGSIVNPGNAFKALTDSVTFHFYAWNSEVNGGSFSIDNVRFSGSVMDSATMNVQSVQAYLKEEYEFELYPNPVTSGKLFVKGKNITSIELCTYAGERIRSWSEKFSDEQFELRLPPLIQGIYTLVLHTELGIRSKKVIVAGQH